MQKLIFGLLSFALLIGLNGCTKVRFYSNEDFKIVYGTACGWCAGEEYISITQSKISYKRIIPCGEDKGVETRNNPNTAEKWDSIWSSFNYNLFKTLDYAVCNICVDGCDEIIRVTKYGDTHEIRYNPSQEIEGIEELQQLLKGIFTEFND